jgi:enolase-phosphatase E1
MRGAAPAIRLLDIEGTTTPIDFVTVTLFSYARARLRQGLGDFQAVTINDSWWATSLRDEHHKDVSSGQQPPPIADDPGIAEYLLWLMDRDRKSTALKYIQGQIWDRGFREGELKGEMFPDVLPAFERWRAADQLIAIYSSGSVQAQQALFGHTVSGDLTHYISAWFDTRVGSKRETKSYAVIAEAMGTEANQIQFVSDVEQELDAAEEAGVDAVLAVRSGEVAEESGKRFRVIRSFDELG